MNKYSVEMFRQIMGAFSHMTSIDEPSIQAIQAEIKRISTQQPNVILPAKKPCCGKKLKELLKVVKVENENTPDGKGSDQAITP